MLKINDKIVKILEDHHIGVDIGLSLLFVQYFNKGVSHFASSDDILKLNACGIYRINPDTKKMEWVVPFIIEDEIKGSFSWVSDEYRKLFIDVNPSKRGDKKSCITRMKKFFSENPDVRKEEVIEATKMYLKNTDSDFIRFPHYFITKGVGADRTSDLLEWIELYRESIKDTSNEVKTVTNSMQ